MGLQRDLVEKFETVLPEAKGLYRSLEQPFI
jgi:hypothetical protein